MKHYLLPFLLLPLAAVAAERQTYTCDNGSRIEIAFSEAADGRPQASLHFADGEMTLPQVPSASGALYRLNDIRLHSKGEDVLFEDGKGNSRRCTLADDKPPVASSFLDIAGSVTYRQRIALPADAVLIIRVQNVSRTGAPALQLAEQRIELAGQQVPIAFSTTIDRDLIGKKSRITVSARIERRGKTLFVSDKSYPALADGQPQAIAMQLKQVSSGKAR